MAAFTRMPTLPRPPEQSSLAVTSVPVTPESVITISVRSQPSITTPRAGPWDSPKVVIRNRLPKLLLAKVRPA